jgi:uncharacterized protein
MGTADNKQLILTFFERFSANDIPGALAMMAEDATWWIAGKPDAPGVHGLLSKAQLTELFAGMFTLFEDGMRMTVKSMIAEADKVAVEVESEGPLKDGRLYQNDYHLAITVRDGKVRAVREYLDTRYVASLFYG